MNTMTKTSLLYSFELESLYFEQGSFSCGNNGRLRMDMCVQIADISHGALLGISGERPFLMPHHRLIGRTSPFQGGNAGSFPVGVIDPL